VSAASKESLASHSQETRIRIQALYSSLPAGLCEAVLTWADPFALGSCVKNRDKSNSDRTLANPR
jgi:hypothetical protein